MRFLGGIAVGLFLGWVLFARAEPEERAPRERARAARAEPVSTAPAPQATEPAGPRDRPAPVPTSRAATEVDQARSQRDWNRFSDRVMYAIDTTVPSGRSAPPGPWTRSRTPTPTSPVGEGLRQVAREIAAHLGEGDWVKR